MIRLPLVEKSLSEPLFGHLSGKDGRGLNASAALVWVNTTATPSQAEGLTAISQVTVWLVATFLVGYWLMGIFRWAIGQRSKDSDSSDERPADRIFSPAVVDDLRRHFAYRMELRVKVSMGLALVVSVIAGVAALLFWVETLLLSGQDVGIDELVKAFIGVGGAVVLFLVGWQLLREVYSADLERDD